MREDSGFGTVEHRDEVLNKIAASKAFSSAGPRTQLKQWLSWVGASHRLLKCWHMMLLGVSYQQVQNGDSTIDALPLFGLPKKPGAASSEEKGAEEKGDCVEKDEDGGDGIADDDAESDNEGENLERTVDRHACKNTLQYVSLLLADLHRNRMIKIICHASTPVWKSHNSAYTTLRSVDDTLTYNLNTAHGQYMQVVVETFGSVQDPQILKDMDFSFVVDSQDYGGGSSSTSSSSSSSGGSDVFSPGFQVRIDDEAYYAKRLWKFVYTLAGYRCLYSAHFTHSLPGMFAGLVSEDKPTQEIALKNAKVVWDALSKAEQIAADGNLAVDAFLKKIIWAQHTSVRETLIILAEEDFTHVPKQISKMWSVHFKGFCQSAVVENAGCKLQDATRLSKNTRVCRPRRMYVPSIEGVISSYKREEVKVDYTIGVPSQRCGPGMFLALGDDHPKIKDDVYRRIHDTATWLSPNALGLNMDIFYTQALLTLSRTNTWAQTNDLWHAALLCPGLLLQRLSDNSIGLVLQCNQVGCLVWPMSLRKVKGTSYVTPSLGKPTEPSVWLLPSLEKEHVIAWLHTIISPLETHVIDGTGCITGVVAKLDKQVYALEALARAGFAGVDMVWLRKLANALKIKLGKGVTKKGCLDLLLRRLIPDASEQDVVEGLAKHFPVEIDKCILDNDEAARDLDAVMNDEERNERTTQKKETWKAKSKLSALKSYFKEKGYAFKGIAGLYTKEKSAEKAAVDAVVAPAPVIKKPMEKHTDLMPPNYQDWLPAVVGATLQIIPSKNQFTSRYPRVEYPKSRTVTFAVGDGPGPSKLSAYRQCIQWLWQAHKELTDEEQPFDINLVEL